MRRTHIAVVAALMSAALVSTGVPLPVGLASAAPPTLEVVSLMRADRAIDVTLTTMPGAKLRYQARCVRKGITRTSDIAKKPTMTVSGLRNGVTWKCSGRVRQMGTWSAWSSALKMKPSAKAPTRPSRPALARALPGAGQGLVTAKAPTDNGGATVTGYQARCLRDGESRASIVAPGRTVVVPGLRVNTTWTCSARAINAVKASRWSAPRAVTITSSGIAAGGAFTCVVRRDTTVQCAGNNDYSQLGDGGIANSTLPVTATGITGVTAISGSGNHVCAITLGARLWCWGYNAWGQIGDGSQTNRAMPFQVPSISGVVDVAAGVSHTCAVTSIGSLYCWGLNNEGQLGNGTTVGSLTPALVPGLTDIVRVATGTVSTCAVHANGTVSCWGYNAFGQLGDGTTVNRLTPTPVSWLTDAADVSATLNHTCAVRRSGKASCWGKNTYGQLGNGTTLDIKVPSPVTGVSTAVDVSVGFDFTCATTADGAALCWGNNTFGQLGDGTANGATLTAGPVVGVTAVSGVGSGPNHSCVGTAGGSYACWGFNAYGQFGNGTTSPSTTASLMNDGSDLPDT